MAARVLRPAFLLTVALGPAGCDKPAARDADSQPEPVRTTVIANPPPPPPPEPQADAAATTTPDASTPETTLRKRTVRNPLPPREPAKALTGGRNVLNPLLDGRRLYAAADGSCYVKLPPPPHAPIPPPGMDRSIKKLVSCPDEMLDPAWDTCLGADLSLSSDGGCVCLRSGNPPPPPTRAECPASAKKSP